MSAPDPAGPGDSPWAPDLGAHRLLQDGRSVAALRPDGAVDWWCAPEFDDLPVCWQLLDEGGGVAAFVGLAPADLVDVPASPTATTTLRGPDGLLEVRDGLLSVSGGTALVRLVRRPAGRGRCTVEHRLRLGGFDAPVVDLAVDGAAATGRHVTRGTAHRVTVRAAAHRRVDGDLLSELRLEDDRWSALVVCVGGGDLAPDPALLGRRLDAAEARERSRARSTRLPRRHPQRARDAMSVLRACTYTPTGAVVASPTTGLPEAPGHDRQFDYRYCWLRDASLSTAVAALLGQGEDARRYLDFVHRAWAVDGLLDRPVLDVRGTQVPAEREVDGVAGWAGSRPVRVGNDARDQRQYDSLGLLAEAVSVHVQCGGTLDTATWQLVRTLADDVAGDCPDEVRDSNGIWEFRSRRPLVDGDLGRWLVLDRAVWIARGWRPWTPRRRWVAARDVIAERVRGALDEDGRLPQGYDDDEQRTDASALMAVAFGLFEADDPRADRLVDAVLADLSAGPYVHRYPPDATDGFSGREGAFLPMSFLAVTALATLGRVEEAQERLDALCARLPRLLSEEVDASTDRLLGNAPLVWTHAELARALYVLDAAALRATWGAPLLWAWRLQRYLSLRLPQR